MTIRAVIFDLDGTLVQTERLKAYSYASALQELSPIPIKEQTILEAFKELVGLSRAEVSQGLLEKFNLKEEARDRMPEFGVSSPWQAFAQIRLKYYEQLIVDPQVIRDNIWPHNMTLLTEVRRTGCRIGLATMSYCPQVNRILDVLNLHDSFDFVASRDDVENGKPDPEIYTLVSNMLEVPPNETLVIEDSPSGVKAALSAGMHVIAVTTPYTKDAFQNRLILDERWVVHDAKQLPQLVNDLMREET
jgi:HAD superfamily hydrolase (TIGR01509 family)